MSAIAVNPIRFLSWNILSDCYAHGILRSKDRPPVDISLHESGQVQNNYSPTDWLGRFALIKSCIQSAGADILCLQEVDHFSDSFEPFLGSIGYSTIYLQRPKRKDGCLIAYCLDRIDLLSTEYINFDDISSAIQRVALKESYERHNVAILAKFKDKLHIHSTGNSFIVANTHLYWYDLNYLRALRCSYYNMLFNIVNTLSLQKESQQRQCEASTSSISH